MPRPCGPLLALLSLLPCQALALDPDSPFMGKWGRGPASSALSVTIASAVHDPTGEVYITESARVWRMDRDGSVILTFSCPSCAGIDVNPVTGHVYTTRDGVNAVTRYDSTGNVTAEVSGSGTGNGEFNRPFGIATDPLTGNVYVHDSGNGRIQVFDASLSYLDQFGSESLPEQPAPAGLAFDPVTRSVYATVPQVARVIRFDASGGFLLEWGSVGTDEGELRWPRSVAVDSQGRVHVASTDGEEIQVFSPDGLFIERFQGPHSRGSGPFHPRDIAINLSTDEKYVNAAYAYRMDKFDASNEFLFSFAGRPMHGPFFQNPKGLAVSPVTGDVFVFDSGHFLLKRFTPGGAFRNQWGGSIRINLAESGLFGYEAQSAVTVDASGDVWTGLNGIHYPGDPELQFIQRFDSQGVHGLSFVRAGSQDLKYHENVRGVAVDPVTEDVWLSNTYQAVVEQRSPAGALIRSITDIGSPAGVALSATHVYVGDAAGDEIRMYELDGSFVASFGAGILDLDIASGLTTDANGNLYVADTFNHRFVQFSPDGVLMGTLGSLGSANGHFLQPRAVALSPSENLLYGLDTIRDRVQVFCIGGDIAACTAEMDADGDTRIDLDDNCPFVDNLSQLDQGSVGLAAPDGIGDLCQCGELDGDGLVDASDVAALRASLAGTPLAIPIERCSVAGDDGCNIADWVVTARDLDGLGPGVLQLCTAAVGP